jgi:outer membrane lipoprotein-sorting protein
VTGCAIALPPPRERVTEEARQALSLLIDRWHEFSDLRALADIELQRGGERQRLTGVLLARAPGSVRFEALSPFGQPFLVAVVHDGELVAYDAAKNEAMMGPATAETTARLLSLPFDPDDLVAILAGRVVPPKDLRVVELLPADEAGPSLNLIGRLHQQRVWMDLTTGLVRQLQITGGRAAARISFQRDAAGTIQGLDLDAGQSYVTGTVRYRNVVVGSGVDPARFTLAIPKGAKIQDIR